MTKLAVFIGSGSADMVVNPCVSQQCADLSAQNTTGDGNHLLHLWLNDSDIAWIESQMTFATADDIVTVE